MTTSHNLPGSSEIQGRDLSLALLASRLSEIGEQIGGMAARLEAAEAAIGEQANLLAESAGLAREVSRLSAAIARQGSPAADRPVTVHPRRPIWAAMNRDEYLGALYGMTSWVTGVLLLRYPATGAILQPCWPAHPAVVEELDWLYWDWTGWALEPGARSRDARTGMIGGCQASLSASGRSWPYAGSTAGTPSPSASAMSPQA